MAEDVKFIDAEQYQGRGDEKISFRMIVLEHFRRICSLASKEFKGGYWETRSRSVTSGFVEVDKFYIPDSREEYSNAVDCLFDILFPHFDEQMQKEYEDYEANLEQEKDNLKKEYIDESGENWAYKGAKEDYKTARIKKIKRKLFRLLSCFLKRNGYLEGKTFEEEI